MAVAVKLTVPVNVLLPDGDHIETMGGAMSFSALGRCAFHCATALSQYCRPAAPVSSWKHPGRVGRRSGCFQLLTGAAGRQYWDSAVAQWKAQRPSALKDIAPPIVSMWSPSGSRTLTGTVSLTATAVDDQDVAGVQFKLGDRNIGAEVTTEAPITKFTLSWDSRSVPNGAYALTATARDAAGNTTTSAGIAITISN